MVDNNNQNKKEKTPQEIARELFSEINFFIENRLDLDPDEEENPKETKNVLGKAMDYLKKMGPRGSMLKGISKDRAEELRNGLIDIIHDCRKKLKMAIALPSFIDSITSPTPHQEPKTAEEIRAQIRSRFKAEPPSTAQTENPNSDAKDGEPNNNGDTDREESTTSFQGFGFNNPLLEANDDFDKTEGPQPEQITKSPEPSEQKTEDTEEPKPLPQDPDYDASFLDELLKDIAEEDYKYPESTQNTDWEKYINKRDEETEKEAAFQEILNKIIKQRLRKEVDEELEKDLSEKIKNKGFLGRVIFSSATKARNLTGAESTRRYKDKKIELELNPESVERLFQEGEYEALREIFANSEEASLEQFGKITTNKTSFQKFIDSKPVKSVLEKRVVGDLTVGLLIASTALVLGKRSTRLTLASLGVPLGGAVVGGAFGYLKARAKAESSEYNAKSWAKELNQKIDQISERYIDDPETAQAEISKLIRSQEIAIAETKKVRGNESDALALTYELRRSKKKVLSMFAKEEESLISADKKFNFIFQEISKRNEEDGQGTLDSEARDLFEKIVSEKTMTVAHKSFRGAFAGATLGGLAGSIGYLSQHAHELFASGFSTQIAHAEPLPGVSEHYHAISATDKADFQSIDQPPAGHDSEETIKKASVAMKNLKDSAHYHSIESTKEHIENSNFITVAEKGDGTIHLARKAMHDFILNNADLGGHDYDNLSAGQMAYASELLSKSVNEEGLWIASSGEKFTFSGEDIAKAIAKAKEMSPDEVDKWDKIYEGFSQTRRSVFDFSSGKYISDDNDYVGEYIKNKGATWAGSAIEEHRGDLMEPVTHHVVAISSETADNIHDVASSASDLTDAVSSPSGFDGNLVDQIRPATSLDGMIDKGDATDIEDLTSQIKQADELHVTPPSQEDLTNQIRPPLETSENIQSSADLGESFASNSAPDIYQPLEELEKAFPDDKTTFAKKLLENILNTKEIAVPGVIDRTDNLSLARYAKDLGIGNVYIGEIPDLIKDGDIDAARGLASRISKALEMQGVPREYLQKQFLAKVETQIIDNIA